MASIHNAIKYGTSLLHGFSRAVGLDELEEGTVRLGETLTPVLDFWSRPEWAFLRGEHAYLGNVNQPAGAAQFGAIGLSNPTGSRILVVLERAHVQTASVPITVADGATDPVFTTAGSVRAADTRQSLAGARARVGGILLGAAVTSPGWTYTSQTTASNSESWPPVVLRPGSSYFVAADLSNQAIVASLRWRERPFFPGELER